MAKRFILASILLAGLWLLAQPACADIPATQPDNLPATLAEVVTFSMHGDQFVADIHWKPPGQEMNLKLQDVPGNTNVQKLMLRQPDGTTAETLMLLIAQKNSHDFFNITVSKQMIDISYMQTGHINGDPERLVLSFDKDGCTLDRSEVMFGAGRQIEHMNTPSWAEFLQKHPDAVEKAVLPWLDTLPLESLLGGTADLWAYQVLADRLQPLPGIDAQVKPLIEQFGDVSPEKRDAASDKLKKLGNPALAVLARLDRSQLSPEQIDRIGQIAQREFLGDQQVKAFKTDKKFLLDCLLSRDEAIRRAAAAQLQAVMGQTIDFDPAGIASKRCTQVLKLHRQLLSATQPTP